MKKRTKNLTSINDELDCIQNIRSLIKNNYEQLFIAVIIHGSIATGEVVAYSDFDGLLIVKNEFLNSKKLKEFKRLSMKFIYQFDPLQHHGWFQISQSDLKKYPQYYLPHEILDQSKLIYPKNKTMTLDIEFDEAQIDYKKSLIQLMANIDQQMKLDWKSERMYQLKSFLSKVMLLPSMYYSVINSKGVFKKHSFDLTKSFFSDEEWDCIVTATYLRTNWRFNLNPFQKIIMTQPQRIFRKITKMYIAPKISPEILIKLDDNFFNSLNLHLTKIKADIITL